MNSNDNSNKNIKNFAQKITNSTAKLNTSITNFNNLSVCSGHQRLLEDDGALRQFSENRRAVKGVMTALNKFPQLINGELNRVIAVQSR